MIHDAIRLGKSTSHESSSNLMTPRFDRQTDFCKTVLDFCNGRRLYSVDGIGVLLAAQRCRIHFFAIDSENEVVS